MRFLGLWNWLAEGIWENLELWVRKALWVCEQSLMGHSAPVSDPFNLWEFQLIWKDRAWTENAGIMVPCSKTAEETSLEDSANDAYRNHSSRGPRGRGSAPSQKENCDTGVLQAWMTHDWEGNPDFLQGSWECLWPWKAVSESLKGGPETHLDKIGRDKLRLQQRCQDDTDAWIMGHLWRKAVGTEWPVPEREAADGRAGEQKSPSPLELRWFYHKSKMWHVELQKLVFALLGFVLVCP